MRLLNFARAEEAQRPRAGIAIEGRIHALADLLGEPDLGPIGRESISALPRWREALEGELPARAAELPGEDPAALRWLPPLLPAASFRDFYAFEEHVRRARARRGLEVVPEWYRFPVFYFSNPDALLGHEEDLVAPPDGEELDFELELGAVLGRGGRDLTPAQAESSIAGYCVLNDWSARRIQREEMAVGLGPAKGKDFATSLGPYLVTPDELEGRRAGKGYDLTMTARVNGRELTRGNWSSIHYSFGEMVARASRGVTLHPGDLFGSGTVGGGCILELGPEAAGGWLEPGDRVELEIEVLGTLANRVVAGGLQSSSDGAP
jgi:fumarylacetoacetate (FAA) hydrolase